MTKPMETYIAEHLSGEMKETALAFADFLKEQNLTFYRDTCECWKDKIYYWVKRNGECVCFIAVADPDEPENHWTVWSEDSSCYENADVCGDVRNTGWKYVGHCGNCGSCGGGKEKTIFGKRFPRVCGCTFRIDNAVREDLPFLKTMVNLRLDELRKKEKDYENTVQSTTA